MKYRTTNCILRNKQNVHTRANKINFNLNLFYKSENYNTDKKINKHILVIQNLQ